MSFVCFTDQRLLERSKLDVYSNDDDVFSEDGRSDSEKVETGEKADLPSLPPSGKLSQENLLKKIDFAGNNSPVGNLQRWVDGHFGNQSPIDFPRELTPPRTPVEDIVSPGLQPSKENHKDKENTCHSKQGRCYASYLLPHSKFFLFLSMFSDNERSSIHWLCFMITASISFALKGFWD